jgi:serine/threonine protein kinase
VLLTDGGVVKVTDFGLSGGQMLTAAAAGGGTTVVRGVGGTPAYISPEQADALAQARAGIPGHPAWLTRRTDVWSWAVSVLEMFAGERTWQWGQAAAGALEDHLAGGPPDGLPPMPAGLADLPRESLRADPDRRPHDFGTVARRLAAIYQDATGSAYPRQDPGNLELQAGCARALPCAWPTGRHRRRIRRWRH